MANDELVSLKMVKDGDRLKNALKVTESINVNNIFKIIFGNVQACFFGISSQKHKDPGPVPTYQEAIQCMQHIVKYMPETARMSKFLKRYDKYIKQLTKENPANPTLIKLRKQMLMNRILIKVCVDVQLSFQSIHSRGLSLTYDLAKLGVQVLKSIN